MSLYALPSLLALIIKLWLIWHVRVSLLREHNALGVVLLSFFALNAAELITFYYVDDIANALVPLLVYYAASICVIGSLITLSIWLTDNFLSKYLHTFWMAVAVLVCVTVFSDLIVAGVQPIAYSMTRIPGKYYWVFQLYGLVGMSFTIISLCIGSFRLKDAMQRKKCTVIFFAILPTILAVLAILVLMQLGVKINATVVVSLTITFFLIVLIYTENQYGLFHLLSLVPYTRERHVCKQARQAVNRLIANSYVKQPTGIRPALREIEEAAIRAVLAEFNGNQQRTADHLKLAKSTLNKKLHDYDRNNNGGYNE